MENSFFKRIYNTLDDFKTTSLFFNHGVKMTTKACLKFIWLLFDFAVDFIDYLL